jgi:hypothetical protein
VTGTEWLLWVGSLWSAWLAFVATDVPGLCARAANLLRQQHLPHWARHGHTPPADDTHHGRHARKDHA